MVAAVVARNVNEPVVAPMVKSGGVCFWRESGCRFCVGAVQTCAFIRLEVDLYSMNFINKCRKFCIFNAIWKDDVILMFDTKRFIPVNFDRIYWASN
jgi:hypothetical protein